MMSLQLPPLCAELPYQEDSTSLFTKLRLHDWPVILDSANTKGENGRYDILAADPFITIETVGENTFITEQGKQKTSKADPFTVLENILNPRQQSETSLPFCGGAIGYFAYDLGRRIEEMPEHALDAEKIPDMAVGIYDWAVIIDHKLKRCWLASYGLSPHTKEIWPALLDLLKADFSEQSETFSVDGELISNLSENSYKEAFNKIKRYITEGDCYQVNLAKRFEIKAEGDAWQAYQRQRMQNAAPFSAFFNPGSVSVMSSSPERLLQVHQDQVETKPIKGTRPRDLHDSVNDKALADDLQTSLKDRAENLMIVDLLRNDLGKVCDPGSIKVPTPFALESFATVHHLVSTVTGKLADDQTAVSLLRACFPGGSITGAPKLRAMEIIEELEPNRRGVYCGSIGYIGFDGNMDTNITIRTLVYSENRLRFWAGGGIVADSEVEAEHQEVHDKAAAMFDLVERFRQS
ncbi:aminodeoxychorismate synthase component I [Methylophaga sp.]|uniref:aminodeoxychorismate synthase component I n=1 Tax=Methylophaga sp. TaxID=2024840 RepID=UPI003F694E12